MHKFSIFEKNIFDMKLPTLLIIFFPPIYLLLSQKLNSMQTDFPEGIYTTMQDFINRKPNYNFEITKKGTHSLNNELVDDNEQFCFFFEKSKDSKIRKAFAIVYHRELYFKLGSIMKYSEKVTVRNTIHLKTCLQKCYLKEIIIYIQKLYLEMYGQKLHLTMVYPSAVVKLIN